MRSVSNARSEACRSLRIEAGETRVRPARSGCEHFVRTTTESRLRRLLIRLPRVSSPPGYTGAVSKSSPASAPKIVAGAAVPKTSRDTGNETPGS